MGINPRAILVAQGIEKVFAPKHGESLGVLHGVNLEVFPGDSIAIVGKSGTGKSTLLHILGTLDAPSRGEIFYLGQNLGDFDGRRLATLRNREMGFVFQFHYLMLEFSAVENVMMPALIGGTGFSDAKKQAGELLDRVGLQRRHKHRPGELSGGEQQRVAIARALIQKPRLLFTDEMTGNLDPVTGAEVLELIRELHRETESALISVTHDEAMANAYARKYRLLAGALVAEKF